MYQYKIKYKSQKSKTRYISSNSYDIIEEKIEQMFHKEIETISFSDMSIYTRDAIKVSSLIFGVLYEDFDRSSSESMMNQIKDYSLVKFNNFIFS